MPRKRCAIAYSMKGSGAQPLPEMARRQRDIDRFDDGCDHLLVLDHGRGGRR